MKILLFSFFVCFICIGETVRTIHDYYFELAKGNIAGHKAENKFGRTTNADTDVLTDVWDGANPTDDDSIWIAPTQARIHAIASTSSSDSIGGVGARTLILYGLTNWTTKETTEVVNLDGVSGPNTSLSYVIIHRMEVLTKGATNVNVGKITATAQTDNTVTAMIDTGNGQTLMAIYGIPSVQDLYMTQFYVSILSAAGAANILLDCSIDYNPEPQTELTNFLTKHTTGKMSTGTSDGNPHIFYPFKKYSGPGILKLQVVSGANNVDVSGGFDFILVDK
jgi:hypothetical protein